MATFCILTSAHQEMTPFYEHIDSVSKHAACGVQYETAKFGEHDLVLCVAGVGMVNATLAATRLVNEVSPDYLLFCGVAGATSPELKIADVVVASEVIHSEYLTTRAELAGTPFEHCLHHPFKDAVMPEWLVSAPISMPVDRGYDFTLTQGRIASTDQFPAPVREYSTLVNAGMKAIDMETAAMYQVGWITGTPCLAVRAISNCLQADGTDPEMHVADVKKAPINACTVALSVINSCY